MRKDGKGWEGMGKRAHLSRQMAVWSLQSPPIDEFGLTSLPAAANSSIACVKRPNRISDFPLSTPARACDTTSSVDWELAA